MSYRTVKVVIGLHPDTPAPPIEARESGLAQRIAIVLDTYRPEHVDAYFDSELFLVSAAVVLQALRPDRLEILLASGVPLVDSLEELESAWNNVEELDREPPKNIRAFRVDELVCVAVPELWVQVGGPTPYHDSYTMSYWANFRDAERIAEAIAEAIREQGGDSSVIRAAA